MEHGDFLDALLGEQLESDFGVVERLDRDNALCGKTHDVKVKQAAQARPKVLVLDKRKVIRAIGKVSRLVGKIPHNVAVGNESDHAASAIYHGNAAGLGSAHGIDCLAHGGILRHYVGLGIHNVRHQKRTVDASDSLKRGEGHKGSGCGTHLRIRARSAASSGTCGSFLAVLLVHKDQNAQHNNNKKHAHAAKRCVHARHRYNLGRCIGGGKKPAKRSQAYNKRGAHGYAHLIHGGRNGVSVLNHAIIQRINTPGVQRRIQELNAD